MSTHMPDRSGAHVALLFGFATLVLLAAGDAAAVPSFSRQTGRDCSGCHTVFPELTPYGRQYKLGGFSGTSRQWDESKYAVPLSAAITVSRNSTRSADKDADPETFVAEDDIKVQTIAGYYGGKIFDNLGALVQYNYDGIERKFGMEMADIRYGNEISLSAGQPLLFGITANNNPSLGDIYNSSPVWGMANPDADRGVMPNATPLIDNTLGAQVGGVGLYALWNDLVYGEVALYRRATGVFRPFSWGVEREIAVDGYAPYWRLALQRDFKPHSFSIGTFGMTAKVFPDPAMPAGETDRMKDIGLDAQYQYITSPHTVTTHMTWIREKQDWNASFGAGAASNPSTVLRSFRADVRYAFDRKYAASLQYFAIRGDSDSLRYDTGDPIIGSIAASPNTTGWTADLNYLPIQYVKLGARYTWYTKFNGASTNYDGFGRSARDNNALFLYVWAGI